MRKKLFFALIFTVFVTIGVLIYVTYLQTVQEVQKYMFRGGFSGSEQLVIALEEYYAIHHTWHGAETVFQKQGMGRMLRRPFDTAPQENPQGPAAPNIHFQLADEAGNVIFDSSGTNAETQLNAAELERAIVLRNNGNIVGYLLPEGNIPFRPENAITLTARITRSAFIAGGIAIAVALVIAIILTQQLNKPLQALTNAARKLEAGDLSQRVEVSGDDEIATLGHAFNQMAQSLEAAETRRKAMTADIAHELRTPLAVQRAHLEALLDGIYELNLENLAPIEEQNLLLSRIVEDLRILALADAGELTLDRSPINIADLLMGIVKRFQAPADEKKITINTKINKELPHIYADPLRLEQILHNLLSNALRHSPQEGKITITADRQDDLLKVQIHDSGPGIPEEALPHIFERFYKVDKARTRGDGGTGLGLSIARKLARAHGGDITASNHPQGGAIFTLHLPITTTRSGDQHENK